MLVMAFGCQLQTCTAHLSLSKPLDACGRECVRAAGIELSEGENAGREAMTVGGGGGATKVGDHQRGFIQLGNNYPRYFVSMLIGSII